MLTKPDDPIKVGIQLFSSEASKPCRAHPSDSCFDLKASAAVSLEAGGIGLVPLGFGLELPEGWEAQIRGRSGLASRGIWCHFGTIDHLYRQEVKVILVNLTDSAYQIQIGDRVAQMTFAQVPSVSLVEVELESTSRGGFGSTGTS